MKDLGAYSIDCCTVALEQINVDLLLVCSLKFLVLWEVGVSCHLITDYPKLGFYEL